MFTVWFWDALTVLLNKVLTKHVVAIILRQETCFFNRASLVCSGYELFSEASLRMIWWKKLTLTSICRSSLSLCGCSCLVRVADAAVGTLPFDRLSSMNLSSLLFVKICVRNHIMSFCMFAYDWNMSTVLRDVIDLECDHVIAIVSCARLAPDSLESFLI